MGDIGAGGKILIYIFIVGFTVFLFCAGIAMLWLCIEDTALGRAINEIMEEHIKRQKGGIQ